jgi:hypothetical protein
MPGRQTPWEIACKAVLSEVSFFCSSTMTDEISLRCKAEGAILIDKGIEILDMTELKETRVE